MCKPLKLMSYHTTTHIRRCLRYEESHNSTCIPRDKDVCESNLPLKQYNLLRPQGAATYKTSKMKAHWALKCICRKKTKKKQGKRGEIWAKLKWSILRNLRSDEECYQRFPIFQYQAYFSDWQDLLYVGKCFRIYNQHIQV